MEIVICTKFEFFKVSGQLHFFFSLSTANPYSLYLYLLLLVVGVERIFAIIRRCLFIGLSSVSYVVSPFLLIAVFISIVA